MVWVTSIFVRDFTRFPTLMTPTHIFSCSRHLHATMATTKYSHLLTARTSRPCQATNQLFNKPITQSISISVNQNNENNKTTKTSKHQNLKHQKQRNIHQIKTFFNPNSPSPFLPLSPIPIPLLGVSVSVSSSYN